MVLTPVLSNMGHKNTALSINQENEDFADRFPFHHASIVHGNGFLADHPMSAINTAETESEDEFVLENSLANARKKKPKRVSKNGENQPLLVETEEEKKSNIWHKENLLIRSTYNIWQLKPTYSFGK